MVKRSEHGGASAIGALAQVQISFAYLVKGPPTNNKSVSLISPTTRTPPCFATKHHESNQMGNIVILRRGTVLTKFTVNHRNLFFRSVWSMCSATCGKNGRRYRARSCICSKNGNQRVIFLGVLFREKPDLRASETQEFSRYYPSHYTQKRPIFSPQSSHFYSALDRLLKTNCAPTYRRVTRRRGVPIHTTARQELTENRDTRVRCVPHDTHFRVLCASIYRIQCTDKRFIYQYF